MKTNRRYAIASLAVMMANIKLMQEANAQVQTITNDGQIVSTGDVSVSQSASGEQYVYDADGNIVATQTVGNDLQIVSTGDVAVDQAASGIQEVDYEGNILSQVCIPGEYQVIDNGIRFCREDGCMWVEFLCESGCKKGRCGRG